MKSRVLLFGVLADEAKRKSVDIEHSGDSHSLLENAEKMFSNFKEHKFIIAVNRKSISSIVSLKEDDEIAFLPPFAGG